MMRIFKPILLTERKPLRGDRFILRLFGGMIVIKRWGLRGLAFRKIDSSLIESWYQEVQLPTAEDMHFIVDNRISPAAHPRERELMQQGARIAIEALYEIIKKA